MGNRVFENCPCLTHKLPIIAHVGGCAPIARTFVSKTWVVWVMIWAIVKMRIAHIVTRRKQPKMHGEWAI